jgi:hypothetical protein
LARPPGGGEVDGKARALARGFLYPKLSLGVGEWWMG